MKKLSILFLALVATTTMWAGNTISYTAPNKLPEVTVPSQSGLHTTAFYNGDTQLSITDHTFSDGQGIITFDSVVTIIGDNAFYYSSLTSVSIPNSVTSIGRCAFDLCQHLPSIILPSSLTYIGQNAFSYCSSLVTITIPYGVTIIDRYAFSNCTSLQTVIIPNSIISIGTEAFDGCSALTSMTIPNSVTSLGESAFHDCRSLTSIDVDNANLYYSSIDGVLFNSAKDTLIQYPIGNKRTVYAIPNSVTIVGKMAFASCTNLSSITIPHSVTIIDKSAFCKCSSLQSLTLPDSLISMGYMAFYNCTSLNSITCYATTPPECGQKSLDNITKSIPIYVPTGSVNAYQTAVGWKDFTNIQAIAAEEVFEPVTTVITTPTDNSTTITWPINTDADSYTIVIYKGGVPFCTLTFNAQGQLTTITFAPGRGMSNDIAMAEAVAGGYKFTITSLDPNTVYTYNIDTKNAGGTTIANYSGTFTTTAPTALNPLADSPIHQFNKVIKNGQLLILRDSKTYTTTGTELR